MGARIATGRSHDGESRAHSRARLAPRALARLDEARRAPFVLALAVCAVALAALGGLTYVGARTFAGRAADERASDEASSLARHSARLATGDAFDAYLQILRYADDPLVRTRATPRAQREAAMQQLLYLNTNDFSSLTVIDRSGFVVAATDPALEDTRTSEAFTTSRASLGPSNADIVLTAPGKAAYVDFAMALRDPAGETWGVLLGRADPARLWTNTLFATVDGSHNIILNNKGQLTAGVQEGLLGQPWRGAALKGSAVRADLGGVDSICGLSAIARDTQIDHGWVVASCIPAHTVHAPLGAALWRQLMVTAAAFVLAAVFASGLLRFCMRERPQPLLLPAGIAATLDDEPSVVRDPVLAIEPEPAPAPVEIEDAPLPAPPPAVEIEPLPVLNVTARRVIEAYEQRNARLAERLRESVQARLLIAATRVEESYRLVGADDDLASTLHTEALGDLENLREREVRAFSQELHPGFVRLGLPVALKALRKDVADLIDVTLQVDATADSVEPVGTRQPIDGGRRIVIYRLARESAVALAFAGAHECSICLRRTVGRLHIEIAAEIPERRDDASVDFDPALLATSVVAVEAFGGAASVEYDSSWVRIAAVFATDEVAVPEHVPAVAGVRRIFLDDESADAIATPPDGEGGDRDPIETDNDLEPVFAREVVASPEGEAASQPV